MLWFPHLCYGLPIHHLLQPILESCELIHVNLPVKSTIVNNLRRQQIMSNYLIQQTEKFKLTGFLSWEPVEEQQPGMK